MATVTSNTNWHIIIVPWKSEAAVDPPEGGDPFVLPGVRSINFNRSKSNPSGVCSVGVVGDFGPDSPLYTDDTRPGVKVGDWTVVYSNQNIAPNAQNTQENQEFFNSTANGVPRFFGQVSDIDSEYDRDENGRLRRNTTVHIKEWSSFLQIPVRYDSLAPALQVSTDTGAAGAAFSAASAIAGDILSAANSSAADTQESLRKIASTLFSAYEMTHLVLKYIDGLSAQNQLQTLDGIGTKLPDVAVRMPAIPPAIFKLLGVSDGNPDKPFSTGMVTMVTGVQTDPINNDGTWNGVYGPNEFAAQGNGEGFDQNPSDRPMVIGLNPLLCQGMSAWQIISSHCDMSVNEFFTDMTFEISSDHKSIIPKPFICVRDKPFALAKLLAESDVQGASSSWTKYDDIPRIYIDSSYIMRAGFRRSMNDTATYIRLNFNPQEVGDPQFSRYSSEQVGVINKTAEQKRFGGQELFLETTFIAADPAAGQALASIEGGNAPWFKKLRNIVDIWHGNMYRMASCVLSLKDHNVALTCGYNLEFNLGGIELVGHIESISADFQMDENGRRMTNWTVQLSRVCCVNADGDLDFLNQALFSNLKRT